MNKQTPRATVLTCSDSRVQTSVFDKKPINDLFMIRNIGNQIKTAEGSIEYGINHLHTPVLLIIGHSECGAIQAAIEGYDQTSEAIRKELDHVHLNHDIKLEEGIIENVHNQVAYALTKFKDKVEQKEMVIVGAIYDFKNAYEQDHGRLILINLNGEKNSEQLKQNALLNQAKSKSFKDEKALDHSE